MTDLLEREVVREAPPRGEELIVEAPTREVIEPEIRAPLPETEVRAPKPTVRWIRWMIAAVVLVAGGTMLAFALRDDGSSAVLDTDGSFQAVEAARMAALAPTVTDLDGSFLAVEAARMAALAPSLDAAVLDMPAIPGLVESTFIPGNGSPGIRALNRTFIPGNAVSDLPEPVSVTFIPGNRYEAPSRADLPEPVSVTFIPGNGSQAPDPIDVQFVGGPGAIPGLVDVVFIPGGG